MKKKMVGIVIAIVTVVVVAIAAMAFMTREKPIKAMYLPLGEESGIFVNMESGEPFYASVPKGNLYGLDRKRMTEKNLVGGNILEIYGDGIMLESYPGQYPGVTKMKVISAGKPKDVEQYNDLVATFYKEPNLAERPVLTILSEDKEAETSSATYATAGSYEWTYENAEGKTVTDKESTPHILNWVELIDVPVTSGQDLTLDIGGGNAISLDIRKWEEGLRVPGKEFDGLPEGESVLYTKGDSKYLMEKVEPGYVYRVSVELEQGVVNYGFLTTGKEGESMEEVKSNAVYLTYGDDQFVFVDMETNAPFFAQIPANELYDINGMNIAREVLTFGDTLEITGNGIMLQSYPGQYPGVTSMKVVEKGKPADVDKYQDLINQIYQEPDPSAIPDASLEYRQPEAVVSSAATKGAYEWAYTDKDGRQQTDITDAAHILQWTEIIDVKLSEPTDVQISFSIEPTEVSVERWAESAKNKKAADGDFPEDEDVPVQKTETGYQISGVEAGYIYRIDADFPNGEVEYGFVTK